MKNYIVYCQDKRARKREIPKGTRKYPVYYLGVGHVVGKCINMTQGFPISQNISSFRFYLYKKPNTMPEVRDDITSIIYIQ